MTESAAPQGTPVQGLPVRKAAVEALKKVLAGQDFVPFGPDQFGDPRDRALANRLITAALRRHGHLNEIMAGLLSKGVPPRSGLFEPLLRLGLTELLFMGGQAAHSAIFLPVQILRSDRRGGRFSKLLNGVLRQAQREADRWTTLDPVLLIPDWLRDSWCDAFGGAMVTAAAKALLEGAALDLTLKQSLPEGAEVPSAEHVLNRTIRIAEREQSVPDLAGYAEGHWWVQDAAAVIPASLIDLPAGARVLDLCAAPGGKTAQLCDRGYRVTALDRDQNRMARVSENMQRLGMAPELVVADALEYGPDEKYDAVLIDAPCTATGTFRRHPEVLWHRTPGDVLKMQDLQRQMIAKAVDLLNDGGQLVFCTCSLQVEEGEAQADWVLRQFPQLRPFPVTVQEVGGFADPISPQGWFRTHPGTSLPNGGKTDGFFAARFLRG